MSFYRDRYCSLEYCPSLLSKGSQGLEFIIAAEESKSNRSFFRINNSPWGIKNCLIEKI